MVFTCPLISKVSSSFTKPLWIVPRATITPSTSCSIYIYIYIYIFKLTFYLFTNFPHQRFPMVSHWSLSDSKSLWVSRTLLSNLADLSDAVVLMISTCSLISRSSSPCTNPLVIVSSTLITIGITIIFMFHSFFSPLARSRYLFIFSLSFSFILWSARTAKFTIRQVPFF